MPYGSLLADVVQSSTSGTAPTFKDGNGTETGTLCRAWVNFNGTGTPAINASFNISSVTRRATGQYTVNITNAMPDANYCSVGTNNMVGGDVSSTFIGHNSSYGGLNTVSAMYVNTTTSGALTDASRIYVAVFR